MKIIKTKWFPFGNYKAINLFGIVFYKMDLTDTELNHEAIHTAQMKEMLYIFFYIWYAIEYIIIYRTNKNKSQHEHYREVSFEEEAHEYESNLAYLRYRKHFSWIKYLGVHSNDRIS